MALRSVFSAAPTKVVRKTAFKPGGTSVGAGLMQQALGPQAVNPPTASVIPDVQTGPAPLPPDAGYDQTVAGLQQNRDNTQAALKGQAQTALTSYGYDYVAGNLTFDPRNPYSQAALAKRAFEQARTGSNNSYAARGQLYSGALQNAQNETNFQEGRSSDALIKGLTAFLAKNQSDQTQTVTDFNMGVGQAMSNRVQNAASSPLYSPIPDAPQAAVPLQNTNAAAAAFRTVPGKDSKGNPGVWHVYPDGHKVFVRS